MKQRQWISGDESPNIRHHPNESFDSEHLIKYRLERGPIATFNTCLFYGVAFGDGVAAASFS